MLFLEKMQQKDILITCIIMISGLVVLSINSKIFFGKCLKTRFEAANFSGGNCTIESAVFPS